MAEQIVKCECGQITGEACSWSGPITNTVVVEYMPEYLRDSHRAAGNHGLYPLNGAQRIRVEAETCADAVTHIYDADGDITEEPDEWVSIV